MYIDWLILAIPKWLICQNPVMCTTIIYIFTCQSKSIVAMCHTSSCRLYTHLFLLLKKCKWEQNYFFTAVGSAELWAVWISHLCSSVSHSQRWRPDSRPGGCQRLVCFFSTGDREGAASEWSMTIFSRWQKREQKGQKALHPEERTECHGSASWWYIHDAQSQPEDLRSAGEGGRGEGGYQRLRDPGGR